MVIKFCPPIRSNVLIKTNQTSRSGWVKSVYSRSYTTRRTFENSRILNRCTVEDLHYYYGHKYKTGSSTKLPKVVIEAVETRKRTYPKHAKDYIIVFGERLYDVCAGFNLRYCRIQGFRSRNHKGLLQDLLVLCCFLVTNLVVLSTILVWTTLHTGLAAASFFNWLRSSRHTQVSGPQSPITGSVSALVQVGETPNYTSTAT